MLEIPTYIKKNHALVIKLLNNHLFFHNDSYMILNLHPKNNHP